MVLFLIIQDAECFRIHKINQIPRCNGVSTLRKECEKLFMKKTSNPLPLPTLKLSEPPGAVRPDGNQTSLLYLPAPGQSPVKLINISPIVPITIGIMLMKLNRQPAKSQIRVRNDERVLRKLRINLQQKMPGDSKAGKQKNKLSP